MINICQEVIQHALGEYPEEYTGRRFDTAVKILICPTDYKESKRLGNEIKESLQERVLRAWLTPCYPGTIDSMLVRHKSGDSSTIRFLPMTASIHAFYGVGEFHIAILDDGLCEEDKYNTLICSSFARGGIIIPNRTQL